MQNALHIIQRVFEGGLFLTGLSYLICWTGGRKLTNREFLLLFAMFAGFSLVDLPGSTLTYILLTVWMIPWSRLSRRKHS